MREKKAATAPLAINEWDRLRKFDTVAIHRTGESPATGQVDDIARDATAFWVNLGQGLGRILVHAADEVDVRLVI